jgi:hypothetical protein
VGRIIPYIMENKKMKPPTRYEYNIYIIIYTLMYTSLPSLQDPWFLGSFDVLDSVSNLEFGLKALNLGLAGWDSIRRLE